MQVSDVERFLTNKGWMTVSNIMSGLPMAVGQKEVGLLLKALTVQGKLDVQPGVASGPRMYRLRIQAM